MADCVADDTAVAPPRRPRAGWLLAALALLVAGGGGGRTTRLGAEDPPSGGNAFFEAKIRPVLIDSCYSCHSAAAIKLKGGLRLDSRPGVLAGGEHGPVIVPGDPDGSRLVRAIRHVDPDLQMPPRKQLPAEVVKDFETWVRIGAPDPREEPPDRADIHKEIDFDAARDAWPFRLLVRPTTPAVEDSGWPNNAVDAFILARLEEGGVPPADPAGRRTLLRRATFDLTGLPPTPEEMDAFLADDSPDAWDRALDRLLASPAYGERWARHWLDVARFAESHGFEQDYDRENAYPYRDFVVEALNRDMPYDQFVEWQIAGDELAGDEPLAWMATGFLGAGAFPTQLTEAEFESARYNELDDMVSTVGSAVLGLSIGCARCHDHKYDPIPTADYYRLVATFTTAIRAQVDLALDPEGDRRALVAWEADRARLQGELASLDEAEQKRRMEEHDAKKPAPRKTTVLVTTEGLPHLKHHADDRGFPHFYPETYFLSRGDVKKKEGVATQGFLQLLERAPEKEARWQSAPPVGARTPLRRAALARWITDTDAGAGMLAARVIANRLWLHRFGRGIVATPSDFGAQGAPPSHPELLDYLASSLVEGGWRLKPLHRLLLSSATYTEGEKEGPQGRMRDPDNRLRWRWSPSRLEGEAIRDSLLALGGLLDRRMGGPGTLDENMTRRSIYFFIKRSKLIPMMQVFDAPEPLASQGSRPTTTIAPQSLLFMNSPLVRRAAVGLADRLGDDPIGDLYRLALGREPKDDERADADAFLAAQSASYEAAGTAGPARAALVDLCHTVLCLNEVVYVD